MQHKSDIFEHCLNKLNSEHPELPITDGPYVG